MGYYYYDYFSPCVPSTLRATSKRDRDASSNSLGYYDAYRASSEEDEEVAKGKNARKI